MARARRGRGRTVVLVEPVDERAHAVVPQLHDAIVETAKYPRAARMKRESLDPVALGLEFGQHLHLGPAAVQASEAVVGPRAAGPARRPRLFAPPAALGGLSASAGDRSTHPESAEPLNGAEAALKCLPEPVRRPNPRPLTD